MKFLAFTKSKEDHGFIYSNKFVTFPLALLNNSRVLELKKNEIKLNFLFHLTLKKEILLRKKLL